LTLPEFLARLAGVVPQADGWKALCPGHDDRAQSLSVKAGSRQPIVLHCHAGCALEAILGALGLGMDAVSHPKRPRGRPPGTGRAPAPPVGELPVEIAAYDYRDLSGRVLYQNVRFAPKSFKQRRPNPDRPGEWIWKMGDVPHVPYRLDEIAAFCQMGRTTVVVVEGEKDADALWDLAIPATTNVAGALKWTEAETAALVAVGVKIVVAVPDNDPTGRTHTAKVVASTRAAGIRSYILELEGLEPKGDTSDFLAQQGPEAFQERLAVLLRKTTLSDVHAVFHRWLGPEYDTDVLDAMLAAAASIQLGGDPCWLMILSGAGAAKTETVQALEGAGALVVSMISSVGALLSGTARREVAMDATGGLLRKLGPSSLMVIKDMTSILSMDRANRSSVLAALREIHDGKWVREIGTEGGRTLTWTGRVGLIAACTSAWDRAHDVINTMGDRFILARFDSNYGRAAAFQQAWKNSGQEVTMRRELAQVVGSLLGQIDVANPPHLGKAEEQRLFDLADLTTRARTGVDVDTRLDVIVANMPEMPTRFAKQLFQVVRGALALGLSLSEGMGLAARCARDSIPPLRLIVLDYLSTAPGSSTQEVAKACGLLWYTAKRALDALYALNLVIIQGEDREVTYTLRAHINPDVIKLSPIAFGVDGPVGEETSGIVVGVGGRGEGVPF
jgi:hypothetical protein